MADTATLPAIAAPRRKRGERAPVQTKTINLALQGGGAHGAFAWGVLDRLLEDERVGFDGISATSAGAMNAICLADGLAHATPTVLDKIAQVIDWDPIRALLGARSGPGSGNTSYPAEPLLRCLLLGVWHGLSDPALGTLSTSMLVFNPTNWNVPQTVTVTGRPAAGESDRTTQLVFSKPSSSDAGYAALPGSSAPIRYSVVSVGAPPAHSGGSSSMGSSSTPPPSSPMR